MYCCIAVLVCIVIHDNFLYTTKEHSTQQLLQCRSDFFVRHRENSKQQLLINIQNKKLLQMMEFSKTLINLEEPIGYPAHTGLISPSICPFVHLPRIHKHIHFEHRN